MNRLSPMRSRVLIPVAVLIALPALWAFADLMLHRDLPGAAALQHLAFRLLVRPLEWLTEGSGHRLRVALGLWGFVVLSAALGEEGARPKRIVFGVTAAIALSWLDMHVQGRAEAAAELEQAHLDALWPDTLELTYDPGSAESPEL